MPAKIAQRAARGGHDVDVRRVRGDDERGRGAAAGAAEGRASERQPEQRVRQIIQR